MTVLAVTAVGTDRPGIIARVTRVLRDHGGNLRDSAMTILGGQFAIVLLVDSDADPPRLEADLASSTADLGLVVAVRRVSEADPPRSAAPTHMLSVYGADRPGIVHGVTQALADRAVNVTDLSTSLIAGEQPVYAMVLEVALPPDAQPAEVLAAVRAGGGRLLEASLEPLGVTTF